jgi:hypothetical protein
MVSSSRAGSLSKRLVQPPVSTLVATTASTALNVSNHTEEVRSVVENLMNAIRINKSIMNQYR